MNIRRHMAFYPLEALQLAMTIAATHIEQRFP
jgi:hypothetical protein